MADWLMMASEYPLILAALIVLATFILEDGATIGAALLALEGHIDPRLGLGALIFGIVLGDLGLYGLGRYAANHPRMRLLVGKKRLAKGRDYLQRRLVPALLSARCLPGMRMPTYVASGFLGVSFMKFAAIAIVAVGIWATLFFSAILYFGSKIVEYVDDQIWIVGVILLFFAIFLPQIWQKKHPLEIEQKDD
jgi:membrane protein DedA with SNARE-associated domain